MESLELSTKPVSEWVELKPEMIESMERLLDYWKEQLLDYWKSRLADAPALELPTDKTRPGLQSYRGENQQFSLPPELTEALKALSRREGVTLFMTLVAAFQVLLQRYSGQDDIVIGTPTSRQSCSKLGDSIGFFINTLVLRTDLSGNPTFRELLMRVREVTLGAYANQNMPFERLVEALHLQRDLSRNPLFQIMFVFQNNLDDKPELNEMAPQSLEVNTGTTQFDLILELSEFPDSLIGRVGYATDLFEAATISRLIGHFQILLEGIIAHPDAHLSELPLLTERERRQQLVEWNHTATSFPRDKCVHELFAMQAAATPQALAVVHENSELTYAELNAQANRLAHYLCELGVKPDTRIAICAERSLNMVVGLLAILKAGGAYVPLDPAYPKERLAFMIEDSAPVALLTQGRFEGLLNGMAKSLPVISLDAEYRPWASRPDTNPDRYEQGLSPEHLAYVVYTSGSTGKPKGVMIEHRGLCNMATDVKKRYRICEKDRLLQFVAIAFDVFAQDLFGALLSGAALVLRSDKWVCGAGKFWALCEKNDVSIVTLPTLFWKQLAQENEAVIPPVIRQIIIGGEAISNKALNDWFDRGSYRPELFNAYGPTETTVNATIHQISADSLSLQSIGRPISNTYIYILDANSQPVPIGVTGEIYIGGVGVARGYLNRPELTAERFVNDPFVTESDARMYKTGDLARWLADGTIEFLGRNDFQVKIRGFRIELGDIESELAGHPAVRDVAVLAREDRDDSKRLVAYLVPEGNFAPNASELRDFLKNKIPEYMMPSAFVFLDALPATSNGKLDRKALPESFNENISVTGPAPRNEIEHKLVDIWQALLGLRTIGIQDNFFDVGGCSLLAVKLVVEVNRLFNMDLSMGAIYQSPTIEELAVIISTRHPQPSWYSVVPIQREGPRPPLFLIHTFASMDLSRYLGKEQPLYFLRYGMAVESTDRFIPLPLLEDLASHYIKELQLVQPHGPYYLIGFSFGGVIAYEMANQLRANGHQIGLIGLLDTYLVWEQQALSYRLIMRKFIKQSPVQLLGLIKNKIKYLLESKKYSPDYCPHIYSHGSDIACLKGYQLKNYQGRVTLFQASDRESMFFNAAPPEQAWKEFLGDWLEVQSVPGKHLDICREPHVQILAEKLKACMDKTISDG
ncbi:MAG: non-ribosomal peptide synthetase [Methylobacter sp.]